MPEDEGLDQYHELNIYQGWSISTLGSKKGLLLLKELFG